MKVLNNLVQNSEEWDEFRRNKIGGSDDKSIKPLTRGVLKGLVEGSAGFWSFVANTFSVGKDGEDDRARGHRLEAENLRRTNEKFGLSMEVVGVWVSDFSQYVHISPDAADKGNKPKHAFEGKAFDASKHYQIIYFDMLAKKQDGYNPLYSLPQDNQDQAVKYFNISDTLEVLHWSLFNERVIYPELEHYVIDIKREHIKDLIEKQREVEMAAVAKREEVMSFMLENLREG